MDKKKLQELALQAGFCDYQSNCLSGSADDCLVAVSEYPCGEAVLEFAALLLESEYGRLARDARRYAWLRDHNAYIPEEAICPGGAELDRLCDEAIAASGWTGPVTADGQEPEAVVGKPG